MNGQCAKRIRYAAACFGRLSHRETYRTLKKSYKNLPYHHRHTRVIESHSFVLLCMHRNVKRIFPYQHCATMIFTKASFTRYKGEHP